MVKTYFREDHFKGGRSPAHLGHDVCHDLRTYVLRQAQGKELPTEADLHFAKCLRTESIEADWRACEAYK
jgi:hypothetical protein